MHTMKFMIAYIYVGNSIDVVYAYSADQANNYQDNICGIACLVVMYVGKSRNFMY